MTKTKVPSRYQRNALAPGLLAAVTLFVSPALVESDWFTVARFVVTILALRQTRPVVVVMIGRLGVMVMAADVGVDGARLVVVGLVVVGMGVDEQCDEGGHRHRHHEHSGHEPLAHGHSIPAPRQDRSLKSS